MSVFASAIIDAVVEKAPNASKSEVLTELTLALASYITSQWKTDEERTSALLAVTVGMMHHLDRVPAIGSVEPEGHA